MVFDHKKFEEDFRLSRRPKWEISLDETVNVLPSSGFFNHESEVLTYSDVLETSSMPLSEVTGGESVGPHEMCVSGELRESILKALSTLSPKEEHVVRKYFGLGERYDHDETFQEIGDDFGVSSSRIREIQLKALRRLRHLCSKYLSLFAGCPEELSTSFEGQFRWKKDEEGKMQRINQRKARQQPKKRLREERRKLKKKMKRRAKFARERWERERRGLLAMKQLAAALEIHESEAELLIEKYRDSHPYWVAEYTLADGKRKEYFTPAMLEAAQIECLLAKGWMTLSEMQQKFCINKKVIFSFATKQRRVHSEWFRCVKRTSYHSPEFIQAFKKEYGIK